MEEIIQKYIKFLLNGARQGMLVGYNKQLWELPRLVFGPLVRIINESTAGWIYSGLLVNWCFTFFVFASVLWLVVLLSLFQGAFSCFQLIGVDFYVERLSFSTSSILTNWSRDSRIGKTNLFSEDLVKKQIGGWVVFHPLSLFSQDLSWSFLCMQRKKKLPLGFFSVWMATKNRFW